VKTGLNAILFVLEQDQYFGGQQQQYGGQQQQYGGQQQYYPPQGKSSQDIPRANCLP
jgi:hypothetical protein